MWWSPPCTPPRPRPDLVVVPAAADRATPAARNGQHYAGGHKDDSYHPEDRHVEKESRDHENDSENDQRMLLEEVLTVTGRAEKREAVQGFRKFGLPLDRQPLRNG
jgi:hypothetical protein